MMIQLRNKLATSLSTLPINKKRNKILKNSMHHSSNLCRIDTKEGCYCRYNTKL